MLVATQRSSFEVGHRTFETKTCCDRYLAQLTGSSINFKLYTYPPVFLAIYFSQCQVKLKIIFLMFKMKNLCILLKQQVMPLIFFVLVFRRQNLWKHYDNNETTIYVFCFVAFWLCKKASVIQAKGYVNGCYTIADRLYVSSIYKSEIPTSNAHSVLENPERENECNAFKNKNVC